MHTEDIMNLVSGRRTTRYFKNEAILAVCLAYRVLEYLRPDFHFTKPERPLDPFVQDHIAARRFHEAAGELWDEVCRNRTEELDSSSGTERLKNLTAGLIARLAGEDQAKLDKASTE